MSNSTDLSSLLPCVEINPSSSPSSSVIWLHGLGADGNDFAPIVPSLNLPNDLPIRFVFPHAPLLPVTINQGYVMPAWFDIYSMQIDSKIDQQGIDTSVKALEALIEKEKALGIPANKIVLAGFSQGAVIALITALCSKEILAGVLFLSGFLPFAEKLLQHIDDSHRTIPIFLAHGTEDNIIPYVLGNATYDILKKHHCSVEWHRYTMGHSVCGEEVEDMGKWLVNLAL